MQYLLASLLFLLSLPSQAQRNKSFLINVKNSANYGVGAALSRLPLKTNSPTSLNLAWPLKDQTQVFLSEFARPVIAMGVVPGERPNVAFFHTAVDITRSSPSISDTVYSPASGTALILSSPLSPAYFQLVLILTESNHVIEIQHVDLDSKFPRGQVFQIQAGQVLGKLAKVDVMTSPSDDWRHVHIGVIDPISKKYLDPTFFFSSSNLRSRMIPTISKVELTASNDLVLQAYDYDPQFHRNLDVYSFSYVVADESGKTLRQATNCRVEFWANDLEPKTFNAALIYDLEQMTMLVLPGFKEGPTDAHQDNRLPRYVLSQFQDVNGKCQLKATPDNSLSFGPAKSLQVTLSIKSLSGRDAREVKTFNRPK